MLHSRKPVLFCSFLLFTAFTVLGQNTTDKANAPIAALNSAKACNASILSTTNGSYQILFRMYSKKLIIEMYEGSGKIGQKLIRINDETGSVQPRPTAATFKSSHATVNLTIDENWTINTGSLAPDEYSIAINGKKIVEGFVVR